MTAFVLRTEESSISPGGAPTYRAIADALRGVQSEPYRAGAFVGPGPRVTRVLVGTVPTTRVAWVYEVPDNDPIASRNAAALVQSIADGSYTALRRAFPDDNWGPVTWTSFNEAVNGPLSWWRATGTAVDAAAAVTRTRDQFAVVSLDADENPVGPTSANTHPGGLNDVLTNAKGLLTALAVAVGAVYIIPPVAGFLERRYGHSSQPRGLSAPRRNPTRRRRARR